MSAAKNFGLGHSEISVSPTLLVRVTFSDTVAANPEIDAEAAAKHLETAAVAIRKQAADAAKQAKATSNPK